MTYFRGVHAPDVRALGARHGGVISDSSSTRVAASTAQAQVAIPGRTASGRALLAALGVSPGGDASRGSSPQLIERMFGLDGRRAMLGVALAWAGGRIIPTPTGLQQVSTHVASPQLQGIQRDPTSPSSPLLMRWSVKARDHIH